MGSCARCGAPTGVTLCQGCVTGFRVELTDVAGIIPDNHGRGNQASLPDELDTTLTRQDRCGDPHEGHRTERGGDTPLVFRAHVGEATWVLHSVMRSWAGDLGAPPGLSPRVLAVWFLEHLDVVRRLPAAGTLVEEVTDAIHQARRAVDRPNDERLYLGPCGSTTPAHHFTAHGQPHPGTPTSPCTEELYGHPWLDRARCDACGTEHRTTQRQEWLRDRLAEHQGTSVEVAGFLRLTGVSCTPAQVRGYAHRRRLHPSGVNDQGHPTYLISDVLVALRSRYVRHAVTSRDAR